MPIGGPKSMWRERAAADTGDGRAPYAEWAHPGDRGVQGLSRWQGAIAAFRLRIGVGSTD